MPQRLSELRPNQGLQKEVVVLLFNVVCTWLEGGELYGPVAGMCAEKSSGFAVRLLTGPWTDSLTLLSTEGFIMLSSMVREHGDDIVRC